MEGYLKENRTANTQILANIIDAAPSDDAKTLLAAYSVEEKTLSKIIKEMLASHPDTIGQVALYLHVIDIDITTKTSIRAVCKNIVRCLDNTMREKCSVCDDWYNVDLNETPVIQCSVCGQGCHTKCYEAHTVNLPGIYFLCSTCDNKKKTNQKPKEAIIDSTPADAALTQDNATVVEEINISRSLHINDLDEDEITPWQPRRDEHSSPHSSPSKKPVCPQYKFSKCENYDQCKLRYDHPPRCRDFMRKGKCRFGRKCKFNHPKLCSSSLSEWKCLNLECRFFHLKGTVRYEENTEAQAEQVQLPYSEPHPSQPVPQPQNYAPPHMSSHPNHQARNTSQNHFLEQHIIETNTKFSKLENLIHHFIAMQTQVQNAQGNQVQAVTACQQPQNSIQNHYLPQAPQIPQPLTAQPMATMQPAMYPVKTG